MNTIYPPVLRLVYIILSSTYEIIIHATSAPAEPGGQIHNVSRYRAHTQVLPQAQKLHVYGGGKFDAFWSCYTSRYGQTLSNMIDNLYLL